MNVETHSTNPLPAAIALGGSTPLTMSSLEVAERTGKAHKNVLADIRKMLAELGKAEADFSAAALVPGPNGSTRSVEVFHLPKRECLTLVAGYSVPLRAAIIDRWMELEHQAADPNVALLRALADPAAMRGLLLGYTERVIALEGQVAEMAPQVQALERIAVADGSLCITDATKTLQVRPKDLFTYLRTHGWIYRRAGSAADVAYQSRIIAGFLEHKTDTVLRGDGSEKVTTQVRVTPKGLAALGKLLPPVATAA